MTSQPNTDDQLRRALEAVRHLKARVATSESAATAPIAIVGIGLRFPAGVTTPDELWNLLKNGTDATSEVPRDRWNADALFDADPTVAGKIVTRRGGFIADIDQFDPRHFGLAPKEVPHLDPQHRLLLETAWESLEHAAIAPDRIAGLAAGVFIGISSSDYAQRLLARGLEAIDPYVGSGNAHSVAAGRIAYTLGLHGPAIAVDTACSSSLVAAHLACQSLRTGECEIALAGGVNLQLSSFVSVNHSRAQMLSPDGRCKAFGDLADGFGRADGCGVIVLKRLADATRDGDRILAIIHGSATNQDGRTSGLTVPNGNAQQAVIRAALQQAKVNPADIDYVEAHGTGTTLGDPIEAHALGAVFADRPAEQPLWLGSIKSNIGHCEAAAGIAGLIKVVLALQHETLPAHLHASPRSTRIDWAHLPLQPVDNARPWPRDPHRRRLAGVSSFGFGGTNAHLIIGEALAPNEASVHVVEADDLLPLSARTSQALAKTADQLATYLTTHNANWSDVCHTFAIGRASFNHRALISFPDAINRLRQLGNDPASANEIGERPRVAFLFSGQGSLTAGVGLGLLESVPAFREAFQAAAKIVYAQAGWEVSTVLADPARIARTEFGQVSLFCLSYSLARTWQAWGIEPDVILGHSVGEYAAAVVAGVFSLEDALTLLIARAQGMGALAETGAMVAVSATATEIESIAAAAGVEIGAYNAPRQIVLTGARDAVTTCADSLSKRGLRTVPLAVRQGYHSREMEPMIPAFKIAAKATVFRSSQCEFISSVSGLNADAQVATAEYWIQQIRQPVLWSTAIKTLQASGADLVIEVGPRGLLTALSQQTWSTLGPQWLTSLSGKTGENEATNLRAAAATAWLHGAKLDWSAAQQGRDRHRLALPTYPFERQRYWFEESHAQASAYRLIQGSVPAVTSSPVPATWHVIGDQPSLVTALTKRGETVVQHGNATLPLVLQEFLTTTTQRHRVVIVGSAHGSSAWIGAAKVLALEFPETWGGLAVIDPVVPPDRIIDALTRHRAVPVAFVNEHDLTADQLQLDPLPAVGWSAKPDVTYLITGGLGALGLHLSQWLVARGARSLLLIGRREPTSEARHRLDAFRAVGAIISVASVDVTNRACLAAVLNATELPLGGVFHAAGAAAFDRFSKITTDSWQAAVNAKVIGAQWLDELTAERPINVFVLFSSIASVWGSQGQTHYAAASQSLDDLAHQRRAAGRPALTVNWGPWAGGGMATAEAAEQLTAIGVHSLDPAAALTTLGAAIAADRTQVIIADVNWSRFRPVYELRRRSFLLAQLPESVVTSVAIIGTPNLAEKLHHAIPDTQLAVALAHVQTAAARVLKLPAGETTPPHTGFSDLGVDSLMAIDLRRQLAADLGVELSATLVFDFPDCERLARHLVKLHQTSKPTTPVVDAEGSENADVEAEAELARKLAQLGL
jgi:acyl transferase domain-containing protein/acyl carrier protein